MAVLWRSALGAAGQELCQILIYGWTGEGRTLLARLHQLGIPDTAVLGDVITEPGVDGPAYHIIGLREPRFVPDVQAALATLVPTAILRPSADKKYLPLHAFWASTAFVHSYATSRKDAAATDGNFSLSLHRFFFSLLVVLLIAPCIGPRRARVQC
jgi:hypothetical protein